MSRRLAGAKEPLPGDDLIEEEGEVFCPICIGEAIDQEVARGEDPGDHSRAMFGTPAQPETLRTLRRGAGKAVVMTFRLDVDTDAELRQVAQRKGVGPSTLARMLLLEGLEREKAK